MYLVLSALTSSPISLAAATKASTFCFTVCMLQVCTYQYSNRSIAYKLYYKTSDGTRGLQCREFPQSIQQMLGQSKPAPFHTISLLSSNLSTLYSGVTDSIVKVHESACRPIDNRAQSITRASF